MRYRFPSGDGPLDPEWFAPLEAVARALAGHPRARFFDLADFMVMCRLVRRGRPDLLLYKHYYTRRYINLDDAGHAYRYFPPRSLRSRSHGRYLPYVDLLTAVDRLDLWELPWMKEGLEEHRLGLTCDDRWLLEPYLGGREEAKCV